MANSLDDDFRLQIEFSGPQDKCIDHLGKAEAVDVDGLGNTSAPAYPRGHDTLGGEVPIRALYGFQIHSK